MSKALVPRILTGEKSMRDSGRFRDRVKISSAITTEKNPMARPTELDIEVGWVVDHVPSEARSSVRPTKPVGPIDYQILLVQRQSVKNPMG
nr:hypothetical protein [Tanacetum cinerariifolium]